MVSRELILKSLEESITKCRKGGSLSSNVKGALNNFREKSRKWKVEHAVRFEYFNRKYTIQTE